VQNFGGGADSIDCDPIKEEQPFGFEKLRVWTDVPGRAIHAGIIA
jgi:hypothetical protein